MKNDMSGTIRALLATSRATALAMLDEQDEEQLAAVHAALQAGGSLVLETTYPPHGVQCVSLSLVAADGTRSELARTEARGGGLN